MILAAITTTTAGHVVGGIMAIVGILIPAIIILGIILGGILRRRKNARIALSDRIQAEAKAATEAAAERLRNRRPTP